MNERIVYTNPDGTVNVIIPSGEVTDMQALADKVVPADATNVRFITTAELPTNRNYRDAWDDSNPEATVGINGSKAKLIAHERRRIKRALEFAPLDKVIALAIPSTDLTAAENARQTIRDKYALIQADIDNAIGDGVVTDVSLLESIELQHGFVQ